MSILALKLSLNTQLGLLDLYLKDCTIGIKHQREFKNLLLLLLLLMVAIIIIHAECI